MRQKKLLTMFVFNSWSKNLIHGVKIIEETRCDQVHEFKNVVDFKKFMNFRMKKNLFGKGLRLQSARSAFDEI